MSTDTVAYRSRKGRKEKIMKHIKKIISIVLATVMVMALGVTAFAAETGTSGYTSAVMYYEGEPAPKGMDTGCFDSVYTNADGDTVIVLKEYHYSIATGTIESCIANGEELVSNGTIVIPSELGSSVEVRITFGGSLATLIKIGMIPMSNPMTCTIVLS